MPDHPNERDTEPKPVTSTNDDGTTLFQPDLTSPGVMAFRKNTSPPMLARSPQYNFKGSWPPSPSDEKPFFNGTMTPSPGLPPLPHKKSLEVETKKLGWPFVSPQSSPPSAGGTRHRRSLTTISGVEEMGILQLPPPAPSGNETEKLQPTMSPLVLSPAQSPKQDTKRSGIPPPRPPN